MNEIIHVILFCAIFIHFPASLKTGSCLYGNCTETSNSTDVIVICDSVDDPLTSISENVTILIYVNTRNNSVINNLCFKTFKKLRVINLNNNMLSSIPKGCFSDFPSLENLSISNNDHLGLDNLYNAFFGLNNTRIKHLYANNINQVEKIYPFPKNISLLLKSTSLQLLHLAYNEIQILESGAIFSLPQTLLDVSIHGNRIEAVPDLLEIGHLKSLIRLDMSFQCSTRKYRSRLRRRVHFKPDFENHTIDEFCNSEVSQESKILMALPSSLKTLISSGMISGSTCIPPINIGRDSMLEYIDLSIDAYYKWIGPINVTKSNQIRVLILSHNQCQDINTGYFDNLVNLSTLDISHNFLGPFFKRNESKEIFQGLKSLKNLTVSYNFISQVPEDLLLHNNLLEKLDISNNALEIWNISINHLKELTSIDCSFNKLETLPKTIRDGLDEISLSHEITLDFHHNKILCSCENVEFINWIFKSRVLIHLSEADQCTGYSGNITHAYVYLNKECSKNLDRREWLYPFQFIAVLFILSVMAIVGYKKRWAIIYRWYLFRLHRKGYTPIGCEDGFQYDAFLSFADEDRAFVDKVVEQLEEDSDIQFKLCVHYRDFTPGKSISKNIVSAVHSSKKTIVFMSRAYLKSHWCNYELRMAVTEESHMNRKVIIMTLLEEIHRAELSLEVLQYYQKNSYIARPNNEQEMKLFLKTLKGVVANDLL
ncbi:toll-like receptor 4 [Saccostrea echinata]|uniref:toll-like receptor 4 n=1 Tax=Saccostrea echinata TaxID=191078 RepID=UPI002A82F410|nr:toll-like receptor 4 [Saccostrea echinata]